MKINAHVLIIDDEPFIREILIDYLAFEDYIFSTAVSGIDALARIGDIDPDVILLDVMMPMMDGFEVCQRLKSDKQWSHIPIILVTALDSKEDLIRGLNAGADEFLAKPINSAELRARVRTMLRIKAQYDELQAVLQLREDLASMIVHDMRQPLTVAIMRIDTVLYMNRIPPEDINTITIVREQLRSLEAFANDLLITAKLEQGKLVLNRVIVNLNKLVLGNKENYEAIAQYNRNPIEIILSPDEPEIFVDKYLFSRMLDNLVSNALKFSPEGGRVIIHIRTLRTQDDAPENGRSVSIAVIDEGAGVPEAHRESIFKKFEVVALRKEGVNQTGLGLAFSKKVIDAHGGRIFVTANSPQGSIFTVEI